MGLLDLGNHGLTVCDAGDAAAEDVGEGEQELVDNLGRKILKLRTDLGEISVLEKSYIELVINIKSISGEKDVPWNAQEEFSVK